MKALIKKELKLGISPACYISLLFALFFFIPAYPLIVVFFFPSTMITNIYISSIGYNNDLEFSLMLPIRKKDYVLSKIFSMLFLQFIFLLLSIPFMCLRTFLLNGVYPSTPGFTSPFIIYGTYLVGCAVYSFTLFGTYFKTYPKRNLAATISIFAELIIDMFLGVAMFYIPNFGQQLENNYIMGLIYLLISILVFIVLVYLTYLVSYKNLEKKNP